VNIHCIGDAITEAFGLPESSRWTVRLQMMLENWKPETFDVYSNGVGGDTSAMGLERMTHPERDSGLTLIQFGFNDCSCRPYGNRARVGAHEYRANLESLGQLVKARGGIPVFILNHPCYFSEPHPPQPDGRVYADKVDEYREICREVAKALITPVIDLPMLMKNWTVQPEDFYADGTHLNAKGQRLYAEMVFSVLQNLL
jgi:lysophospholipase L1-like esterase